MRFRKLLCAAAAALTIGLAVPLSAAPGPPAKGYLFIIGGGDRSEAMMKRFVSLAEGFGSGKIIVFPMASSVPQEVGPELVAELANLGAKDVESLILTREQAMAGEGLAKLENAGGVFFSGGDQSRQTAVLLDTPLHAKVMDLYRRGATIGGTSAGAAVMSELMITGDEVGIPTDAEDEQKFHTLDAGKFITARGFGFITNAIIDQHFIARKRHNRLITLVAENPELLGVAIDEDTAIIVGPDQTFEVMGESNVLVFDAHGARPEISASNRIRAENILLHILAAGDRFSLKTRKVVR